MIRVEGLTKLYGSVYAVRDVSFEVAEGRILGFLGPNGAGKSTTMRILTGYLPATSGRAACAGYDVFAQSIEVRKRIGYLPERVPIYREMRVQDYLQFVAAVKGLGRGQRPAHIDEVMRLTDIAHVRRRIIGNLSRGYQQRVGLAQALIGDPPVLILDEPTVGLDPKQIVEIRELIRSFKGQRTVILSTHILPEVNAVCDDVAIISEGRIVAQDSLEHLTAEDRAIETVRARIRGPVDEVRAALAALPAVEAVRVEASAEAAPILVVDPRPGTDPRAEIAKTVVGRGWDLTELQGLRRTLEQIFLEVVTRREQTVPGEGQEAA